MTLTLLPAVDVAGGQAVRLVAGAVRTEIAAGSPLAVAQAWQAGGAAWIHLVDLDAAFDRGTNAELLDAVVGALDVPVQLSGGIRDDVSLARALSTGCDRVVLGTPALEDPTWCARVIAAHGERVAVGLDVRVVHDAGGTPHHRLAARGRTDGESDLWPTLERLDQDGCARYVVTDVRRDGALRGPNLDLHRAVTNATTASVIASGGVAAIGDLVALAELAATGANLEGVVVGSALAAGRFALPEALAAVAQIGPGHDAR